MHEVIGISLLMAVFCIGVDLSMQQGMIFNPIRERFKCKFDRLDQINERNIHRGKEARERIKALTDRKRKSLWYLKPTVICVYCFSSFWGSAIFLSTQHIHNVHFSLLPFCIFICTGMISIILNLTK